MSQEQRALDALERERATSRQADLADDRRLADVVDYLAERSTEDDRFQDFITLGALRGLVAFARERLAVNRGLIAQQRQSQPAEPSESFDLALVTDEDLLAEVAARLKR